MCPKVLDVVIRWNNFVDLFTGSWGPCSPSILALYHNTVDHVQGLTSTNLQAWRGSQVLRPGSSVHREPESLGPLDLVIVHIIEYEN